MSTPHLDKTDWLAQAWADWIRPLGLLIVALLAYLGYRFDFLGERAAGLALVVSVLFGILGLGVLQAWGLVRRNIDRSLLLLFAVLSLGGAAWPSVRSAWPPAPLASARLSGAAPQVSLATATTGPYELVVSGRFRQAGTTEAEASYTFDVEGDGKEQVSGELKRTVHHYRASRRGGTALSLEEHTESVHRLQTVNGATVRVSAGEISEQLDGGLDVALRRAGPDARIFWALGALAILLGLVLDVRLAAPPTDSKLRGARREVSYLTSTAALLLVFAINFSSEANARTLVKAGVGAFFLALLLGGVGGWMFAALVRLAAKGKRRTA